jgi:hypothetical protein
MGFPHWSWRERNGRISRPNITSILSLAGREMDLDGRIAGVMEVSSLVDHLIGDSPYYALIAPKGIERTQPVTDSYKVIDGPAERDNFPRQLPGGAKRETLFGHTELPVKDSVKSPVPGAGVGLGANRRLARNPLANAPPYTTYDRLCQRIIQDACCVADLIDQGIDHERGNYNSGSNIGWFGTNPKLSKVAILLPPLV